MTSRKSCDLFAVALLLMLISATFGVECGNKACETGETPTSCPQDCTFLGQWPGWVVWAALIIGIVALLLAIAFIVSRVFLLATLEAWVKEELGNIMFTVMIIVLFAAFAGAIETASSSLADNILQSKAVAEGQASYWTYNSSNGRWNTFVTSPDNPPSCQFPCHIYMARGFLGSTYENYKDYISGLSKEYAISSLFESLNIGSGVEMVPFGVKLDTNFAVPMYPSRAIYNNTLNALLTEVMKIIGIIKFQEIALVYMTKLVPLLFIFGILLRIPWFTRKLGGLLVALAIGSYAIFPLVYVMAWYTVDRSMVVMGDTQLNLPDLNNLDKNWDKFTEGGIGQKPKGIDLLFTTYGSNGKEVQMGLIDVVGRAYAFSVLLPLLAIFITIGFVRHFSPMIGGDTEIAGLTKII